MGITAEITAKLRLYFTKSLSDHREDKIKNSRHILASDITASTRHSLTSRQINRKPHIKDIYLSFFL